VDIIRFLGRSLLPSASVELSLLIYKAKMNSANPIDAFAIGAEMRKRIENNAALRFSASETSTARAFLGRHTEFSLL